MIRGFSRLRSLTEYLTVEGYEQTKTKLARFEGRMTNIEARADLAPVITMRFCGPMMR